MVLTANDFPFGEGVGEGGRAANGFPGTPLPVPQAVFCPHGLGDRLARQSAPFVPSSGLHDIPSDQKVGIHLPQPAAAPGLAGVPVLQ